MATQTNKQLFLDNLATTLPAGPSRQMLLDLADMLIPAEDTWKHVSASEHPFIHKAIRAFKKSHPMYRKLEPPIEVVVDWLLRRGGIIYAASIEKKLCQVHEVVMGIGAISLDKAVPVNPMAIIKLRVLSDLNPLLED